MKTTVTMTNAETSIRLNARKVPFTLSALVTGILLTTSNIQPAQAETKSATNQQLLAFTIPAGSISEALLQYSETTGNR
jgi:hypothetical protein